MKRFFTIIILLCIAYFICGYGAVFFGLITQDQYLAYTGVFGGLASIIGLFSFIIPTITKDDLHSLELDTLKSLAETAKQVKELEEKRLQTKSEIGNLEVRKKEMEFLIKKASMSLFLKEQYSQKEHKILSYLNSNNELQENLSEIVDIKKKLDMLEEEIKSDPNVEILREVIESANRKQDLLDEVIYDMPPLTRGAFLTVASLDALLNGVKSKNEKYGNNHLL